MPLPKRFWRPQGSLFAALLDTAIACWCLVTALQRQDRWLLWAFAALWGALAAREWYAYLHKDNVPRA
jgi:hypothetical protein